MGERRNRGGGRLRATAPIEARPTGPQRRFLERGLTQPGGKLPLFDRDRRPVPRKTIEACLAHGWAEPWIANPIKPPIGSFASSPQRVIGRWAWSRTPTQRCQSAARVKRSFTTDVVRLTALAARAAMLLPGFGRFPVKLDP
jgi:hypothetical protein